MAAALALARRGLGRCWPNPAVGCVLVRDGRVVGRGLTGDGGRPHAETVALRQAGAAARGATAYVTLEPCAHRGVTPPCADALVEAGLARVVIALADPDIRTGGRGTERLARAGIATTVGVCDAEARAVAAGHLSRVERQRPLVTLKIAATLDGRVAAAGGERLWITGDAARRAGHMLRAEHDAVMVGRGTVASDDPSLTCRLPGLEARSPVRIVVDSALRTPPDCKLVRGIAETPLWLIGARGADAPRARALSAAGAQVLEVERDGEGRVSLVAMLREFARRGLTRVLAEGGPTLSTALLAGGLVDRLVWFSAPRLLGADATAAIAAAGARPVRGDVRLAPGRLARVGGDAMMTFGLSPAEHG